MPRISAEARGAAAFRAGGTPPEPPKHLNAAAKAIWRRITLSKPVDWFDEGSIPLLGDYCAAAARAEGIRAKLDEYAARDVWEGEEVEALEKRAATMTSRLTSLATKLRLSVQANVEWHSRKIGERAIPNEDDELIGHAGKAN